MDFDSSLLNVNINPTHFPAKLWLLTNDSQQPSVFWSPSGEGLMVDEKHFQEDLFSSVKQDSSKIFKTRNFNSFIRQLNLYGFHKVFEGFRKDAQHNPHHFHSPYFKKGRPELLVHLKRLTNASKLKPPPGDSTDQKKRAERLKRALSSGNNNACHQPKDYERKPVLGQFWFPAGGCLPSFHPHSSFPAMYGLPSMRPHFTPSLLIPHMHHPPLHPPTRGYSPVCPACTSGFFRGIHPFANKFALPCFPYPYYPVRAEYPHAWWAPMCEHGAFITKNYSLEQLHRSSGVSDQAFQRTDDFQVFPGLPVNPVEMLPSPGASQLGPPKKIKIEAEWDGRPEPISEASEQLKDLAVKEESRKERDSQGTGPSLPRDPTYSTRHMNPSPPPVT